MALEVVQARGLSVQIDRKMYGSQVESVQALGNCHFELVPSEVVAILGPSGCGKTTLLRLVLGLDVDYEGDISVDGRRVRGPGSDRGVVFQEPRLLPWFSVEKNVAFALPDKLAVGGEARRERRKRVRQVLDLVGLGDFAKRLPKELSGGMAQRVALARALVNLPGLLLLDEPFGALDAERRMRLQGELESLLSKTGTTTLLVTHDVDEALYLSDRIVLMTPRPGRVREIVAVDVPRPRRRDDEGMATLRMTILKQLMNEKH